MPDNPARGGYLSFTARNARFLGFGFLIAFGSSFGQTYSIGIFGPHVQAEFGLSRTAWGTVYMVVALASATLLPWSGKPTQVIGFMLCSRGITFLLKPLNAGWKLLPDHRAARHAPFQGPLVTQKPVSNLVERAFMGLGYAKTLAARRSLQEFRVDFGTV